MPDDRLLQHLPDGLRVRRLGRTGLTLLEGFATEAECEGLIDKARDSLQPSTLGLGEERGQSDRRTSESALVLSVDDPDSRFFPLVRRAAALIGSSWDRSEGLWVGRYSSGGAYVEHLDYYQELDQPTVREDGNRSDSFLVYLNDVPEGDGGETEFPRLGLAVQPRRGTAVHWRNVDADGRMHPETLHAGRPVLAGEKWILNAWFREKRWFAETVSLPEPSREVAAWTDEDGTPPSGCRRLP